MQKTAAQAAQEVAANQAATAHARNLAKSQGRPKLTAATVVAYIDWITTMIAADHMSHAEAAIHLRAAELVLSKGHAEAQAKATTATLIDDGLLPAAL